MSDFTSSTEIKKVVLDKTTPVPNELLDRVMPTLRDTELRVLLVVIRQTLGWQDGPKTSQRKPKDWLTQSQLMRRTGRASGAVARAVDALVKAGLINVSNRAGTLLRTPAERRRHLSRLYYQLNPIVLNPIAKTEDNWETGENLPQSGDNCSKSKHAKAHTTKETVTQKYTEDKECREHGRKKGTMDDKEAADSREEQPPDINPLHITPFVVRTRGWERASRTDQ